MAILASDTFTRANETPLASPWTNNGFNSLRAFKLASNAATPSDLALDSHWYYSGVSFPADQYSQAKITVVGTTAATGGGVHVRSTPEANQTGQVYRAVVSKSASNNVAVRKTVGGVSTALGNFTTTWVNGDVLRLEAQGSTLRAYQNGVQVGTDISDAAIASGAAGLAYSSTVTSTSIDDWEAGSVGVKLQLNNASGNLFTTPSAGKLQVQ